jgi:hypothetical protein
MLARGVGRGSVTAHGEHVVWGVAVLLLALTGSACTLLSLGWVREGLT